MPSRHEPNYEEIKNLASKLYLARARKRTSAPSDMELKLGGYWKKAREILQGRRRLPKYVQTKMFGVAYRECPMCGRRFLSNLIRECDNCHKVGCPKCLAIRTYVDIGYEWISFSTLRSRKDIDPIVKKKLPKKKLCRNCLYVLDLPTTL